MMLTYTDVADVAHQINAKGDMMNLTDMWKAAGGDLSRQPAEWLRSADARRFCASLAGNLNMGNSQDDLIKSVRGGKKPGTFAHWQIGLAYAKYLSPHFHMWCNTVVREKMEAMADEASRVAPSAPAIDAPDWQAITASLRETNGIARMLSHKSVTQEKSIALSS